MEIKGWIEMLLLQQIAGVEWSDGNEEEDNENEKAAEHDDDDDKEDLMNGAFTFSTVEAMARFMAAMLYSTNGRHDQAMSHLARFRHLTHRLHPNMWSGDRTAITSNTNPRTETQPTIQSPLQPACFAPSVLPTPLYQRLCELFAPDASYWIESDYGNRGYYSYFMDYEPNRSPTNLVEEVIVHHLLPLAQQLLTQSPKTSSSSTTKIVGFEWWVHTRPIQANLGHNLHFDTEEGYLEQHGQITHPIVSSVLYLTSGNQKHDPHSPAGATIVLDQTPDSTQVAQVGWRNEPRDNTFLVFPGNLLHGVLPCPGVKAAAVGGDAEDNNKNNGNSTQKMGSDDKQSLLSQWKEKLNVIKAKDEKTQEAASNVAGVVVSPPPPSHRLTFMVGFWTRRVPDQMKERPLYGPCGPLPTDAKWVDEMSREYYDDSNRVNSTLLSNPKQSENSSSISQQQVVPLISPVWEELAQANDDDDGNDFDDDDPSLQLPRAIDHRFFVQNAPQCFRDTLFEKD
jgi:hypothetical protein